MTVSRIKNESGMTIRIEIRLEEGSDISTGDVIDSQDEQNTPAVSGGGEEIESDPLLLPGESEGGEKDGGL